MGELQEAVKKQDISRIHKLSSDKGLEWIKNSKDLQQNSILHIACDNNLDIIFRYALKIGVDINGYNIGAYIC